jgi:hypothetical protein
LWSTQWLCRWQEQGCPSLPTAILRGSRCGHIRKHNKGEAQLANSEGIGQSRHMPSCLL